MKKSARLTLSAVLAGVLAVAPQALAQENASGDEKISVGLRLGALNLDSDRIYVQGAEWTGYRSGLTRFMPGLELAVPLNPNWSLRTYIDYVEAKSEDFNRTGYGRSYGVDALYHTGWNNVYVGIGANHTSVQDHADRMIRGTVGMRHTLAEDWFLRTEAGLQTESDFTDGFVNLSINRAFGSRSAVETRPAPAQEEPSVDRTRDSDGDGVPDYRDDCPDTPAGHVVDDRGCTVYEEVEVTHELRVTFEFDSAVVRRDYFGDVREVAEFMREYPDVNIRIEGHTDLIGPADYNQDLSERRAKSVGDMLVNEFGISRNRIDTVGYGMTRPIEDRITLEANAKNRRIEATLSVTETVPKTR